MNYSCIYLNQDSDQWILTTYGGNLIFTSDVSLDNFIYAMKDGQDTLVSAIMNGNIFVGVPPGDLDAATAVINDFFCEQNSFWLETLTEDFYASQYDADFLSEVFSELADYMMLLGTLAQRQVTKELARKDPLRVEKIAKALEFLHNESKDPEKARKWIARRAEVRAKRGDKIRRSSLKSGLGDSSATWAITTFNGTDGEALTFVGHLPINMPMGYTVVSQPARSFTMGNQTLGWYSDTTWLTYGDMGWCVQWTTVTGRSFAVMIWIPLVVFGVGSDPYYKVWMDSWGPWASSNWVTPPGSPAAPYTFPDSDGWGYTVTVNPDWSGGETLYLQVDVTK